MARILAFRRGYDSRIKPIEALLVVLVGIMAGLLYYPALGVIQDWRRPGQDAPLPPIDKPYPKEWEKSRESREIQREQEGRPGSWLPGEQQGPGTAFDGSKSTQQRSRHQLLILNILPIHFRHEVRRNHVAYPVKVQTLSGDLPEVKGGKEDRIRRRGVAVIKIW